jgi:hypothetical protein
MTDRQDGLFTRLFDDRATFERERTPEGVEVRRR